MSTRSSIWLRTDEKGRDCHLYWELAEGIPGKAAPIFLSIEVDGKETTIRLLKKIAQPVRNALDPDSAWEVL